MEHPSKDREDSVREMGRGYALMSVGITFALTMAGLVLLGLWLDRRLATTPLMTLIGTFGGMLLGGYWMYQRVIRSERRKDSD